MKIVINGCYGGFGLSEKAYKKLGLEWDGYGGFAYREEDKRMAPELIEVVEELGEEANGEHAKLKIVEVPNGIDWELYEMNGVEWIAEKHRTWS